MNEEQIKFISACIIQSLAYLRKEKIIHRDLRMQNLIMDNERYLNIIDFSFALRYSDKKYLKYFIMGNIKESSPERLELFTFDYNSDYYNLGVIIYYLIYKKYFNEVKKENNKTEIYITNRHPYNYSAPLFDFLNQLLTTNYKERIGFKTIDELKKHRWFKGFKWIDLQKKKIKSPLVFFEKREEGKLCSNHIKKKKCKIILNLINEYYNYNYNYINKKIIIKILNKN